MINLSGTSRHSGIPHNSVADTKATFWCENALRFSLRRPIFKNFSWGGMPPDPPSVACFASVCVVIYENLPTHLKFSSSAPGVHLMWPLLTFWLLAIAKCLAKKQASRWEQCIIACRVCIFAGGVLMHGHLIFNSLLLFPVINLFTIFSSQARWTALAYHPQHRYSMCWTT